MWKESSSISRPQVFLQQLAGEQRRLLQTVVGKASWKDGTLQMALFEPFEILRHSNREGHGGRQLEKWVSSCFQQPARYILLTRFRLGRLAAFAPPPQVWSFETSIDQIIELLLTGYTL